MADPLTLLKIRGKSYKDQCSNGLTIPQIYKISEGQCEPSPNTGGDLWQDLAKGTPQLLELWGR